MHKKIVVCGSEIANNIYTFGKALEQSYQVTTVCLNANLYYATNHYDICIYNPLQKSRHRPVRLLGRTVAGFNKVVHFLRLLRGHDAFVYVWIDGFLPLKIDLFLLRLLRKTTIVFHCGDDVRFRPIQSRLDREVYGVRYFDPKNTEALARYESSGNSFLFAFSNQWLTEMSGATIVSLRSHATFQKRPHYFFRFPQKQLLDAARGPNVRPLLLHAPSNRTAKNTECVLEAIKLLRQRGCEFDFELIEGQPNHYVLQRLLEADILIDQPGPWVGRLGVEALASSCVVVGANRPDYYQIDDQSPVVQFEPDCTDLANKLQALLADYVHRRHLMQQSFDYWQRHYSEPAFSGYISRLLDGTAEASARMAGYRSHLLRYAQGPLQRLLIKSLL